MYISTKGVLSGMFLMMISLFFTFQNYILEGALFYLTGFVIMLISGFYHDHYEKESE